MSTHIAIRLPDDLVAQLDDEVRKGTAATRTELIRALLERALRRAAIEAEQAVLAQLRDDPDDLAGLATWAGHRPLPVGD